MEFQKIFEDLSDYELLALIEDCDEYSHTGIMPETLANIEKKAREYTYLQAIQLVVQLSYREAANRWRKELIK